MVISCNMLMGFLFFGGEGSYNFFFFRIGLVEFEVGFVEIISIMLNVDFWFLFGYFDLEFLDWGLFNFW